MKNRGFTLIELLVAMGIVAVLTGLALFNFNQSRVRARDLQRKSDVSQLQKAMEVYKIDKGSYPTGALTFQTELQAPTAYINTTFRDPRSGEWVEYQYKPVNAKSYYLFTCLENPSDSIKTVDTTKCGQFTTNMQAGTCNCGTGTNFTGAAYIITQP